MISKSNEVLQFARVSSHVVRRGSHEDLIPFGMCSSQHYLSPPSIYNSHCQGRWNFSARLSLFLDVIPLTPSPLALALHTGSLDSAYFLVAFTSMILFDTTSITLVYNGTLVSIMQTCEYFLMQHGLP